MNDLEMDPAMLFQGPISWIGVRDSRLQHLDPLTEQSKLTSEWDELFWTGLLQSPRQFRAFAHAVAFLVPNGLEEHLASADVNDCNEIEVVFDSGVAPEQIFGEIAVDKGRIGDGTNQEMRWVMIGVARSIAVGGFVTRSRLPSLGHELGRLGGVSMRMLPLLPKHAASLAK